MRRLWPLGVFLFLLLLLSWPPLLQGVVERGFALAGFQGRVGAVRGNLLFGLSLEGVVLRGPGLALEAQRAVLRYDLLGLLRRELPLSLRLEGARLSPTWEALLPQRPGPPPALRFVFRSLVLKDTEVVLPRGKRLFLPSLRLALQGENPYRFLARLPGGSFQGEARALSPDLSAWEVGYRGEVRGLSFFYEGLKGGRLSGTWRVGPEGVFGENLVEGGVVELVGFTLREVRGPIRFQKDRVEAALTGVGLEGPLWARAEVDLGKERYRFTLEGRPKLPALARHYGLSLPVEGEGRLSLKGEGWDEVKVQGAFAGEGRLLGEPFRHRGTLSFDRVFGLEAEAEGRLFDRTYTLALDLLGGRYGVRYRDSRGSGLSLVGEGEAYRGEGQAAWPKPLEGLAKVAFSGKGSRWELRVESPKVALPLFKPLDLSGEVRGEGSRVQGRLGPLGLSGTWEALALTLAPTPLAVGRLEGEGRWLGGRLSAELRYASPYAAFPVRVLQGEKGFRFQSPYGEGSYQGGVLALRLRDLPIQALDALRLSGEARYGEGGLSGSLRLLGRYLEAEARLEGLGAEIRGRLATPLGDLSFAGAYDPSGLRLRAQGLSLVYREGVSLKGEARLGGFALRADLAYGEGFSGFAELKTPYGVEARLLGEGKRLGLALEGYVEGGGEVYPELRLSGRLLPPLPEGLALPPLAFTLDREALRMAGVGEVGLGGRFPFRLSLPFRYRGLEGHLQAEGDLEGGRVRLATPYGAVEGKGPWRALALEGEGSLPGLGPLRLGGAADLPALAYRGEVGLDRLGLTLGVFGQGKAFRLRGVGPGLRILGGYGEELSLLLQAEDWDLSPLGLPLKATGTWGDRGGRLRLVSPYGEAELRGEGLLSARVRFLGPYLEGEGALSPEGYALDLKGRYRAGGVEVQGEARGEGSWEALALAVRGEARLPYLGLLPFQGRIWGEKGVRYRLEGPVRLEGEGASYRGSFSVPVQVLGREGEVSGRFQGEGLQVAAEGEGVFAGLPFSFQGGYRDKPFLALRYAGGEVVWEGEGVRLALEEVAPLAEALGVDLSGRVQGQVDLEGGGEVLGEVALSGEPLSLAYGEKRLRLFLPRRGLGLLWDIPKERVEGLGDLQGGGRLSFREVEATFRYRGLEAALQGPWEVLALGVRYGGVGETALEATLDLPALKGEGRLRHASAYGEGALDLRWEGARYWGEGRFQSLLYLRQEGALRLEGEGGRARLVWEAPLSLEATYDKGLSLALEGEGEVAGFGVRADLAYGEKGYRGWLRAEGRGLRLEALGEGPLRLSLRGEELPGEVEGEATLEGLRLLGSARYGWRLGAASLEAEARFQWDLAQRTLEVLGEGALVGEGERVPFRFAQEGFSLAGLRLWGEAPGFRLRLEGERLSLALDKDLTPFGLPARAKAEAEGPWQGPVAFRLERPEGAVAGKLWLLPLRASFSGEVYGEALAGAYGAEGLVLRFLGPRLSGEARYGEGLSGRLAVAYALSLGALRGEVDLGAGTFRLKGEGGLTGEVEGGFCLPKPFGGCSGLEASLAGALAYGEVGLEGRYRYRAEAGYLGVLSGEGRLATPYGGVRLLGRGLGLDLAGEGLPLSGRLDLSPFRLAYRYQGALPQGLGVLEAEGVYPGAWLKGVYRYGEVALGLKGLPGFRVALEGEGLRGEVGPEGVRLDLEGFAYGPLRLKGQVAGPWREVALALDLEALGRKAHLEGRYGEGRLSLDFSGDLSGQVAWDGVWRGEVAFREGRLALSGEKALPHLKGEVLGQAVALAWPHLLLGGLSLDLVERRAEGEARLPGGVEALGEGEGLAFAYEVPGLGLPLRARLDLKTLALELTSPEGEGALRYAEGRVSGALALGLGDVALRLGGEGERVALWGGHPASPWWVAGAGELAGWVGLDGAYRLDYRAGAQALSLEGRLLSARLLAQGPYLQGELTYPSGGSLALDLPLPPLEARFQGRIGGEGYRVEGVLAGGVGRVQVKGSLLPLKAELLLEEAALEDFAGRYAPYLKGRVSGRLLLEGMRAQGSLEGRIGVGEDVLPFAFTGRVGPGSLQGEGRLGESSFSVRLASRLLELRATPRGFPLHLLLAAVAGPLEGEAYWTGAVRLRLPLADWRQGEGVLVGENLVFRGGGDELKGRAAFRFAGGRLSVDYLRLSGKGLWEGGGYWSPEGSDLYLSLKDTVFTPVLQVVPALKPYRPEGSGTLDLRLTSQGFQVGFRDFRFRLGPVAGYLPQGLLALNGGARAEGELTLTAPFPGRARLGLEGTLQDFRLTAKGEVSLPGLQETTPAEVAFRYPAGLTEVRLGGLEVQGTLFPLRLAGYGRVNLSYPGLYLQEGLLQVENFFLYQEGGTYHLTASAKILQARLALASRQGEKRVQGAEQEPIPLVFEGVRLYAERGVLIQESLAQGEFRGEVYLGGTYADPFLSGEARPLWGSLRLWDVLFSVDPQGSYLRFSPDRGILPEFHLKASGEARGHTLYLEAEGRFVREDGRVKVELNPRFTSDPELTEPEIYALLALGSPDLSQVGETLPQTALNAALANFILGQLEKELAQALGLDQIQISTPVFQGGALEDTRFSVGKYLNPNVFLGYEVDLRGSQSVHAQYQRDGLTLSLVSRFPVGENVYQSLALGVGYQLTPQLGLSLELETGEALRFSVGALYRW
ncbi:translocation/assembly module TamB [Thermus composti]|uniref:Translocation/assembly module TamB domain-containing protein n=1 Tax=Thermus composti TaxID=532059 RepID=A0ABV6Q146_9DEIN|nr:translocation/assembly module TamB domain-containing protein [Thermus composti]GGM91180.1 translocation/assembly module TamB [Thermus composti]